MNTSKQVFIAGRGPPFFSIAMLSGAALAYEILLMRLFSIIQWHHFAYMIISLALLGYGASGTMLALTRRWMQKHFFTAFIVNAILFGISSMVCFRLAQTLPFNALEVLWDYRQPLWLLAIFMLLFIPFFCVANCVCLAFLKFSRQLHRVYSFDLIGAGIGALSIIGLLFLVTPTTALQVVAAMGLLSAAVAWLEYGAKLQWPALLLSAAAILMLSPAARFSLQLSQFKGLSQALQVVGAEVIDQRSSPLGWLTTVSSPSVPFRHAPGLSLNNPAPIPAQLAVFVDGDAPSVITRYEGALHKLSYLDFQSSALPYHLLEHPVVLILGAGGGADVLQALYYRANQIDAVELNPQMVELVQSRFADYAGDLYLQRRVALFTSEARGFVTTSRNRYDLIQVAMLDSFNASSGGLYALSENYLYTREAFTEYLRHLRPEGILSITRWTKTPPRDALKVFATAIAALTSTGVTDPQRHLVMIRSWNTSTLLVKKKAFSQYDIDKLKDFCRQRFFDLVHYPGIAREEANIYNQLPEPWFFDGAQRLLSADRVAFMQGYKFNIHPSSDDRPYFSQFLKWRTVPELLELSRRGGMPLLEWGYLVLIVTLAAALVASVVLVLLPMLAGRRIGLWGGSNRLQIIVYFSAIGLAFMFIEIAFIQKFTLFLHHPLYAVSVVLCAFLVFAGIGSRASAHWKSHIAKYGAGIAIGVLSILYLLLLPFIFDALTQVPIALKIPLSVALIAPLALLMGTPFPLGLSVVSRKLPASIPWAWAINGCASIVGAILATLLAVHFGFVIVVTLAVILYLFAALSVPR